MSGKQVQAGQARRFVLPVAATLVAAVVASVMAGTTQAGPTPKIQGPVFRGAKAFDVSKPLRELAKNATRPSKGLPKQRGPDPIVTVSGTNELALGPAAVPSVGGGSVSTLATTALAPLRTFEGLSNVDNFNLFGFRVNPPDPVGDVGPNHYVEMINLVFGVYDKSGNLLLGPVDTGTLWDGFPVEDCTDPSGDPIVLYDQFADRWILSQFTTRGLDDPTLPFYNCVAISQTGDPTGSYYRYAFTTGTFFPDYPKYGIWKDSYVITTREFGPTVEYGIGVYAIDRNKMIEGDPSARVVSFFVDGNDPELLPLVGDGLLPADVDGNTKPKQDAKIPIVGTQDDDYPYGATFDALNIWELDVHWNASAGETRASSSRPSSPWPSSTRTTPVARPAAAWRSPGSRTPTSGSTSSRTANDRRGGLRTGRSRTTRRW